MLGRRWAASSGGSSDSSSPHGMDSGAPGQEWSALKREAQLLEARIERSLQEFGRAVSTRSHRQDEERGRSAEDNIVGQMQEIDDLLERLRETLARMAHSGGPGGLSRAHSAALGGHHEVLDELEAAARRHRAAARHALEAASLLQQSGSGRDGGAQGGVSESDVLLRERAALMGSHKAIDGALAQAAAAHEALLRQRSSLGVTAAGLGGILARVPGVGGLMDAIQRRRLRNDQVIAVVIGAVVCFALWYYVLRKR